MVSVEIPALTLNWQIMKSFILTSFNILLLLHLIVPQVFAQYKIEGKIIDKFTGESLPGASIVQTDAITNGTSSDQNGQFSLILDISLSQKITISYVGYEPRTLTLTNKNAFMDIRLTPATYISEEVIVSSTRVDNSTPMSFSEITYEQIQAQNLGQDIPYLLKRTPSVITTSDAGAGIGYTGIRIRGVDPARINVTINGIPINDAESHGVWWVNMPDLASSIQSIQVQRGVGTSTNGAAAFGASINIETTTLNSTPYATVTTALGSYNTQKINTRFGTGIMKNGWSFDVRLSKIRSDGYIDRAFSKLDSWFINSTWHSKKHLLKITSFSGKEKTYQAWYGTPKAVLFGNQSDRQSYINRNYLDQQDADNLLNSGRTYNFYTYDNETDNYRQSHYQLHYSYKLSENTTLNSSLHYTNGIGYYETYRKDDKLLNYNINPVTIGNELIERSDLIRRKWLDNDFYGIIFSSLTKVSDNLSITSGLSANRYDGSHFGTVIWSRIAGDSEIGNRYYDNDAVKDDYSGFLKTSYSFNTQFLLYADIQIRSIHYRFEGIDRDSQNNLQPVNDSDNLLFINPKAGVTYTISVRHKAFASISIGNKEPTRVEYVESIRGESPVSERLIDYEIGYEYESQRWFAAVNGYFMNYKDQLVITGQINDVGAYVRQNVDKSYRVGLEIQTGFNLTNWLNWSSTATLSKNRIKNFTQYYDNYDLDYVNGRAQQSSETYKKTDIALSPEFIFQSIFSLNVFGYTGELEQNYISEQYLDNTSNKERSIPSYFVTNFTISREWQIQKLFQKVKMSFQVNNLFNELYASNGYTFSYIYGDELTTENFYYPQAERHFLINMKIGF